LFLKIRNIAALLRLIAFFFFRATNIS